MQGDYRIGFRFMLPDNLPGSLMYKNKKRHDAPHAKVKYFVKASIVSVHDSMCLKHKAVLCVREKEQFEVGTEISETSEIKTWGCCAQGTSSMKAKFNKNIFSPQEEAEANVEIDNSQCNLAIKGVKLAIRQELRQKIGRRHSEVTNMILEREIDGPAAQAGDWKETIKLELDKIRYEVSDTKKKKGVVKKISIDDRWAMA